MEHPLVSILIPVYKRTDLAVEAIECALSQDYEEIEIIVGDNCSPDGTFEQLNKKFGKNEKVILFQNERNLGAVGNWERCLARANGKYVKFLWSDDLMAADCISKSVSLLETHHRAAFVYSSVRVFSDLNQLKNIGNDKKFIQCRLCKGTKVFEGERFIGAAFCRSYSVPVSPGCAVFRREKLHIVGDIPNKIGYDHRKNGAGPDILMFLEAAAEGETFVYMDYPASFFRNHSESITSSDNTITEGYWTAKQYFLREHGLEKYWKPLNSEIISHINHNKIFSKKQNMYALSRFLDTGDIHIKDHSVISVIAHKMRKLLYLLNS